MYDKLCEDELIAINQIDFDDGNVGEAIEGLVEFDENLFEDDEIKALKTVVNIFGILKTKVLVELSHQEKAWLDNKQEKELISYPKYAFDLKNIEL